MQGTHSKLWATKFRSMGHWIAGTKRSSRFCLVVLCLALVASMSWAGPVDSAKYIYLRTSGLTSHVATGGYGPYIEYFAIGGGNLQMPFSNVGNIGEMPGGTGSLYDIVSGDEVRGTRYPRESKTTYYLNWDIMVGAVVGNDTVVSQSYRYNPPSFGSFWPDAYPQGAVRISSFDAESNSYSSEAKADVDAVCEYMDTLITESNPHKIPLGIKITQRTMGWYAPNIDDFVIIEYRLENIGKKHLRDVYVGFAASAGGTGGTPPSYPGRGDDYAGFLHSYWSPDGCHAIDTVEIVYGMDNDGDPENMSFTDRSPLGAAGLMFLQLPVSRPEINYNWYGQVYKPDGSLGGWEPHKLDHTDFINNWFGLGTNEGLYTFLSRPEFDYNQLYAGVNKQLEGWAPPDEWANLIDSGGISGHFYSFGKFDLHPGEQTQFTIAIVAGDNVHVDPRDYEILFNPFSPYNYLLSLNFSELTLNARWAKWVFDNPGVDTDGDGYFGKFRVCEGDTNWYEGDGVPDFRADIPPPSPLLRIIPSIGKLTVRWNGYYSENVIDPFTKVKDFEGYRVYSGLDDRESSTTYFISWDYPNFNRYFLYERQNHTWGWATNDLPLSLDSLLTVYGEAFNPLLYTRDNPLHVGDALYSFTPVDYNLSSFLPNGVHKVYPEAINPGADTALWTEDQLTTEHGSPLPKYYEYEYIIENVLPTVANYISVTSFDFGFAKGNIPARESSKRENQTIAYAQTSADSVTANNLSVYVYPNPYVWQKDYHTFGYENRDNTQIPDRSHRINFSNLPPKCRISVYSLDGDLIRSWEHDYDANDPQAMHDTWDLITRNTMLAVAGLYYWVVESSERTQIGKLVIVE